MLKVNLKKMLKESGEKTDRNALATIRTELSKKIPDLELILNLAKGDITLTSYVEKYLEELGILDKVKKIQKYFSNKEESDEQVLRWADWVAWSHPMLRPYVRERYAKRKIERAVEGIIEASKNLNYRTSSSITSIMWETMESLNGNEHGINMLMDDTEPLLREVIDKLVSEGLIEYAREISTINPKLKNYLKDHKHPNVIINSTFEKSYTSESKEERTKLYDSALRLAIFEEPKGARQEQEEREKERQEELLIFILDLAEPDTFFRNVRNADVKRYEEMLLSLKEISEKLQYSSSNKSYFEEELSKYIKKLDKVYGKYQPELNHSEEDQQQQELKEFKEFLKDRRMI
jgi:hypothetical protein